ncbi:aa3-type cytochrome c oxidase subunit IV [Granulibacter bethesdensis]|uniref:Uncharacterized protein n=2 Tax=Granulibacter bethesdensis TaxID=364410 RepID=A0A286M380_GRABC|nr:aa3-type cytochrome c oxidase subunit IV [Granulibacter bethesdensis]APG30748.1 Hypothetical protein GbCGDNIH2_8036 [Granulibacter bethesdensis]APG31169.1 Hypothetical protein GbCGDNIH4_8036 [Granulibacter bethesdensis CGDNIH4]APH52805.1 Hypothetical protein GbCGDNIH5_8036 [Granulibacter bethesdensis]APH60375.1 Hypothetical protein GbCGDNIH7_8036 [Granulibacter bethesdensis]APH65493.1 Hypothetical protein GbCGDNIH1I4_8036 [Granulibacter bethesdensis]
MSQPSATYARAPITSVDDLLADRKRVYAHFVTGAKVGIAAVAIILALMGIFLT